MAKPILYGVLTSPGTRCVLLTAEYLGVELDFRVTSTTKGDHLTPEFFKINPLRSIPVLDDNGNKICDSHAIATYLVNEYHPNHKLYPSDPYERAKIDQRLLFDSSVLFPIVQKCVHRIKYYGAFDCTQEDVDTFRKACEFMNSFLKSSDYIAGNSLSLADFFCAATISHMKCIASIDYNAYGHLKLWLERMGTCPEFVELNTKGLDQFETFMTGVMEENRKKIKK